jgi:hypothetical protein
MPFGYIGQNQTKQKVKNTGVLSSFDISLLEKKGQAGGSLEFIQSQTISSTVAQVDFTSIKENLYDVHLLVLKKMTTENDNKRVTLRFFESGTIETATVYHHSSFVLEAGGSAADVKTTSSNDIRITDNTGNGTDENCNTYVYLYNLGNSSKYSYTTSHSVLLNSSPTMVMEWGGGVLPQASTVDGIRVLGSGSENLTAGNIKLYGVKQI